MFNKQENKQGGDFMIILVAKSINKRNYSTKCECECECLKKKYLKEKKI